MTSKQVSFLSLGVLAIYTVFTGYQAYLSRQALYNLERAWVSFLDTRIASFEPQKPGRFIVTYENTGKSFALNLKIAARLVHGKPPPYELILVEGSPTNPKVLSPPLELPQNPLCEKLRVAADGGTIVPAGQTHELAIRALAPTEEQFQRIQETSGRSICHRLH